MKRVIGLVALLSLPAGPAQAELVVVVGACSNIDSLTREEVVNIFMGRYRKLADGSAAHPVDLSLDAPERQLFYRKLLNKNLDEINAYWSRLVFAGRTLPPDELGSRESLQSRLERDPTAIAYIERSRMGKEMRVVLSLPE